MTFGEPRKLRDHTQIITANTIRWASSQKVGIFAPNVFRIGDRGHDCTYAICICICAYSSQVGVSKRKQPNVSHGQSVCSWASLWHLVVVFDILSYSAPLHPEPFVNGLSSEVVAQTSWRLSAWQAAWQAEFMASGDFRSHNSQLINM